VAAAGGFGRLPRRRWRFCSGARRTQRCRRGCGRCCRRWRPLLHRPTMRLAGVAAPLTCCLATSAWQRPHRCAPPPLRPFSPLQHSLRHQRTPVTARHRPLRPQRNPSLPSGVYPTVCSALSTLAHGSSCSCAHLCSPPSPACRSHPGRAVRLTEPHDSMIAQYPPALASASNPGSRRGASSNPPTSSSSSWRRRQVIAEAARGTANALHSRAHRVLGPLTQRSLWSEGGLEAAAAQVRPCTTRHTRHTHTGQG
jgi:hypothetical protein